MSFLVLTVFETDESSINTALQLLTRINVTEHFQVCRKAARSWTFTSQPHSPCCHHSYYKKELWKVFQSFSDSSYFPSSSDQTGLLLSVRAASDHHLLGPVQNGKQLLLLASHTCRAAGLLRVTHLDCSSVTSLLPCRLQPTLPS